MIAPHAFAPPPPTTGTSIVRCLDCGATYSKPVAGGVEVQNPGCPACSYLGWAPAAAWIQPQPFAILAPAILAAPLHADPARALRQAAASGAEQIQTETLPPRTYYTVFTPRSCGPDARRSHLRAPGHMRVSLILIAFAALLVVPSAAAHPLERYVAGSSSSLSLSNGQGVAIVASRDGAILGTVGRGRITLFDGPRGTNTRSRLSGCRTMRRVGRHTRVCTGRNLSFSVVDGTWRLALRGSRINASAVLRGSTRLEGRRGTYRIDDGAKRPWPDDAETLELG